LVAALDWGNGHQTRTSALIHQFLDASNTVEIACSQDQRTYWEQSFPNLTIHCVLPDNKISWSKWGALQLIFRIATFRRNWQLEKDAIALLCQSINYDLIISDNRYGVGHSRIKSVLLTHQLRLGYSGLMGTIGKWMISRLSKSFHEIWVPDLSETPRLAGKLSQSEWINQPVKFIGPLTPKAPNEISEQEAILILLSGPEPQRTAFAQQCMNALEETKTPVLIAGKCNVRAPAEKFTLLGHVTVNDSIQLQASCKYVISRSGYTSLMELHVLHKKAILIPTPGQIEQQYLAKYWNEQFQFPTCKQKELTSQKIDILLSQL
jgi:hypothetical protein